ncbi:hypothetical protein K458DRAFT_475030 [Lentithecium fluviatile CBS 122367]|uniref:Nucleoporin NUP53 n=1 Tax=Lentithecium fluviatile CBS 122367 TaxID=1168545 RepID=A0A6G1JHG8_9PLEO|nr:hypothetical protein K458DRAFT_475030 [Lentithecium fluviatile CBS 122367]
MQVHAVPDSERAFDSTGRRLPWAFEYADSESIQRRIPEEKGPFGKARKRGVSRSRTPNTKHVEDTAKLENLRAIDDIFTRYKAETDKSRSLSGRASTSQVPISASAPNLLEAGGLSSSFQTSALPTPATKEPKEVILYGYGNEVQWAAISHFERVSGGIIYEQYERGPQGGKYGLSFGQQQSSQYNLLSKSAMAKVNEFVGGDHWIKVTFDSAEAAERACHYSPHNIQGYTVFAEPYRGTAPTSGDKAIRTTAGGSVTASPNTLSSATMQLGASQSSATMSSATATASEPSLQPSGAFPWENEPLVPTQSAAPMVPVEAQTGQAGRTTGLQPDRPGRATLRIRNAKPVKFLPQEKAFLPSAPRWQQTLSSFPVIGWVIGSGHGIIGDQVPRNEDGKFDNASASLYWRLWYAVDSCFGTDFCGVKDAEYEE